MAASEIESDPRFSHILLDPRFKRVPKNVRKVSIDPRFKSMFSDKRFKVKYSVDKRGRKVEQSSHNDLRKYYSLEDDVSTDKATKTDDGSDANDALVERRSLRGRGADNNVDSGTESVDYARGEGNVESSSSSEEESEDFSEEEENQLVHGWAELDKSVVLGDDTSSRLAICNMNWDRITAQDLYVLFNSFKPQGSVILSVKILPSDYGLERMAAEEVEGPVELVRSASNKETIEGGGYSEEKLREYQLNRLKYYYAVVECDSTRSAEAVYSQCDGLEYESSSSTLDLRFIPDDMSFDDCSATSTCTGANVATDYQPSEFCTTALQQSGIQLTWDETDPKRVKTTMRTFNKDEILDMDYQAYLASSSDEEDKFADDAELCSDGSEKQPLSEEEKIASYRALLSTALGEDGHEEEQEDEMEITFEPGLQETTEQLVRKKLDKDEGLTTWETYQKQKKQKRKQRKAMADQEKVEELSNQAEKPAQKKRKIKGKMSAEDEAQNEQQKSELELLMMDNDDGKEHFSLKGILKKEKGIKKRGKKSKKPELTDTQDSFTIDVSDPRFSALYKSHNYALDPSNPLYKPTKGMGALMEERLRQRSNQQTSSDAVTTTSSNIESSVVELIKSVKSKAKQRSKNTKSRPAVPPSGKKQRNS